jgi:hypothetical protein
MKRRFFICFIVISILLCLGTILFWRFSQWGAIGADCQLFDNAFSEIDCGVGRVEFSLTHCHDASVIVQCSGYVNGVTPPRGGDYSPSTGFYFRPIVGDARILEMFAFRLQELPNQVGQGHVEYWYADIPYWFLVLCFGALTTLLIRMTLVQRSKAESRPHAANS